MSEGRAADALRRGERGDVSLSAALLYPVLFMIFFASFQILMFHWANTVVEQATQQGVRAAALAVDQVGAVEAEEVGRQAAVNFLENGSVGSQFTGASVGVSVSADGSTVSARITAEPAAFIPGLENFMPVEAFATGPVEQFIPYSERS